MQKLASILLCFISITSFSQNGFYLAPEIGVGHTNALVNSPQAPTWPIYSIGKPEGFTTYTGQLGIGYHFNNWNLTSGIRYIKAGYAVSYATGDFITIYTKEIRKDNHIAIPLVLAYQFNFGKHFFFAPGVGGEISYNYSERVTTYETFHPGDKGPASGNEVLKGSKFEQEHHVAGIWAIAQAQAGYKINTRLAAVAGPQIQAMLTSVVNRNDDYQKNYVISFNAGVVWRLKDNKSLKNTTE
jgi:hypothetical protein